MLKMASFFKEELSLKGESWSKGPGKRLVKGNIYQKRASVLVSKKLLLSSATKMLGFICYCREVFLLLLLNYKISLARKIPN